MDIDARELVWLYNRIPMHTNDSCVGHVQSGKLGDGNAMRFLPELEIIPETSQIVDRRIVHFPERYVYRGKEVQESDLVAGTFCHRDENPSIYPVEKINELRLGGYMKDIKFAGARLLGLEENNDEASAIAERLRGLISRFNGDIKFVYNETRSPLSFSTLDVEFNPGMRLAGDIIEQYGSLDKYWEHAINTVLAQQKRVYEFWKCLTEVCRDVIGVTRADFEAVMSSGS